jgi:response regulator RpfG family c-di-GMP phosphodiesterase
MTAAHDCSVRPRILCIDDDPAIVAALAMRFRAYDVDVLTAFFGTQGIWLAITERPDVIITDIRMPNGDGDYVVECLKGRDDTCDIPVIVLTGTRDRDIKRWMLTLGVEAYLQKPANFAALLEAVGKLVELKPLQAV